MPEQASWQGVSRSGNGRNPNSSFALYWPPWDCRRGSLTNPATLWARTFVAALAQAGLRAACVAPGSRSTPLVLAFARQPDIEVSSHLDERSASFFALGMSLAQDRPVALLCTSGTAAANFYPAVVEANLARVPLLVITADRPPELRHSGANQTIEQVKLYGDHALWSVDCAPPEAQPSQLALRQLATLAARCLAQSKGLRKGVVHVNMPFRKPLEPDTEDTPALTDAWPVSRVSPAPTSSLEPDEADSDFFHDLVREHSNGLIVCGPGSARDFPADSVFEFARAVGWPLICDPMSGLRYEDADVVACADTILAARPKHAQVPDLVLRLGAVPTSAALNAWLDSDGPEHQIQLSPSGTWADDSHRTTGFVQAGHSLLETAAAMHSGSTGQATWWCRAEKAARKVLRRCLNEGHWFDGAAVAEFLVQLPENATLFAGNSLPVRLLDQFGLPQGRSLHVFANRGASGIDGNISTALGLGHGRARHPLVALVGDITFYHDMNGLLAIRRLGLAATIVLLNNNGGGIFRRLPVHALEPEFTDLFLTPHGLEFSHAARLYGIGHIVADSRKVFQTALTESIGSGKSTIIEVPTDSLEDLRQRDRLMEAVGVDLDRLQAEPI
ncbi:MAG: 2-succinyl-5-enolpyruvyl-6-hydroxy-3-cyclohexene-1-carboxylic-acid synthase [Anaerolineaceae bacterium]|nr:2-succinyl-5-enolpyruvyl-6-hydroxy-3-cyclohexene-1-carboxylic-acid synthase [Anaerolineaceae bacterium]